MQGLGLIEKTLNQAKIKIYAEINTQYLERSSTVHHLATTYDVVQIISTSPPQSKHHQYQFASVNFC